MRSPTSKSVGTLYTCVCGVMWCVSGGNDEQARTNLLNFLMMFTVMVRNPNMGYLFLNKVRTLPQVLGHSFLMNLNMVFARSHIIPQYCAMAIDCCCRRVLCFSDISKAAPETVHDDVSYIVTYKHGSVKGKIGAGGEDVPLSDAVHCRVVGSSLSETSHSGVVTYSCLSFFDSSSVSGSTSEGGSGHWRRSKAAMETPAVPEIIFNKRCSRALHRFICEGNCSVNWFLYLSTRFATRLASASFARLLSSFNKSWLSCNQAINKKTIKTTQDTCFGLSSFFLARTRTVGFRIMLGASGENTFGSIGPALRPLRSELVERLGVLDSSVQAGVSFG